MHHSVTVIVPVHNQLNHLKVCCEIVLANFRNDYPDGQLIVVDINSNDGTEEWLSSQKNISYIAIDGDISRSQAYNVALEHADGEMILFLNSDAYITDHTIVRLERYLYSDKKNAAVGPVSHKMVVYSLQEFHDNIPGLKDMFQVRDFSEQVYRRVFMHRPIKSSYLYSFCLLAKKNIIMSLGGFDNSYYANVMEDVDLTMRMVQAGYELLVIPSVFVYNDRIWPFSDRGYDQYAAYETMQSIFYKKWKFNFFYASSLRFDLLRYIDFKKNNLAVLEAGCGMGTNFAYIKSKNSKAVLCGVELCEETAFFAQKYADVRNDDLEKIVVPEWENKFDYIVMGDIVEHLIDPWSALKKLKVMLKSDGCIIASIPNIMNAVTMYHILSGKFTYADSGILDKTHMRFFTKYEIEKLFNDCGYNAEFLGYNQIVGRNEKINEFENEIMSMKSLNIDPDEFNAMQYIIKATKM